jgi:hypothetical protein
MSPLLTNATTPPVTRTKTAVINLVKAKAPTKVKHDAEWWAAWLKANW